MLILQIIGGFIVVICFISFFNNLFPDFDQSVFGKVVIGILGIVGFCVVAYFIFLAFTSGGSDLCGGGVTSYDC